MRWTNTERHAWRALCAWLRQHCPASKPIRVRRVSLRDPECADIGTAFLVRIDRRSPYREAIYDLAEEWAHAIAGVTGDALRDHGPRWGRAMATVRQAMLRWECQEDARRSRDA